MLSHPELVALAARWLRDLPCWPVLTEPSGLPEIPDAIGWRDDRDTFVLDCKCSEADWRADMAKPFRGQTGIQGLGQYRLILCEPGVLEPWHVEEHGWGLAYAHSKHVEVVIDAVRWSVWNEEGETHLLRRAVRDLERSGARTANDARPSRANNLSADMIAAVLALMHDGHPWQGKELFAGVPREIRGKTPKQTFINQLDRAFEAGELAGVDRAPGYPRLYSLTPVALGAHRE